MKLARMPPPSIPPKILGLPSRIRFLTRPQLLTRLSPLSTERTRRRNTHWCCRKGGEPRFQVVVERFPCIRE